MEKGKKMTNKKLTDKELANKGWSRCPNCGTIRSTYTGLDFHNHATEDCIYSTENEFIIKKKKKKIHIAKPLTATEILNSLNLTKEDIKEIKIALKKIK